LFGDFKFETESWPPQELHALRLRNPEQSRLNYDLEGRVPKGTHRQA